MSDEVFDELEKFDEHFIDSYTIKFEESIKVKSANSINNIKPEWVKEIIVNVK